MKVELFETASAFRVTQGKTSRAFRVRQDALSCSFSSSCQLEYGHDGGSWSSHLILQDESYVLRIAEQNDRRKLGLQQGATYQL